MTALTLSLQDNVESQAREALASGAFPWYDSNNDRYSYRPPSPPSILERLYSWIDSWFPEISVPSLGIGFDWASYLIWGLVVGVLIFLLYQLFLVLRETIENRKSTVKNNKVNVTVDLADLGKEFEIETATPEQIWAMACRLKQDDQTRRAISLAWLAIVRRFGARHELHDPNSLTPRQWGREARRIHPMLQLEKLVGFYEIVIFGNRRPGRSALDNWWAGAEKVFSKLEWGEKK